MPDALTCDRCGRTGRDVLGNFEEADRWVQMWSPNEHLDEIPLCPKCVMDFFAFVEKTRAKNNGG